MDLEERTSCPCLNWYPLVCRRSLQQVLFACFLRMNYAIIPVNLPSTRCYSRKMNGVTVRPDRSRQSNHPKKKDKRELEARKFNDQDPCQPWSRRQRPYQAVSKIHNMLADREWVIWSRSRGNEACIVASVRCSTHANTNTLGK